MSTRPSLLRTVPAKLVCPDMTTALELDTTVGGNAQRVLNIWSLILHEADPAG